MQPDQNIEQVQADIRNVIASKSELGEKVCAVLIDEVNKLGLESDLISDLQFNSLSFTLNRDPFSQLDSLEGNWSNQHGIKVGSILFHGDGSFFAEYDVVQPHPTKKNWFVEAVTAWGNEMGIKSEARLLPMPE